MEEIQAKCNYVLRIYTRETRTGSKRFWLGCKVLDCEHRGPEAKSEKLAVKYYRERFQGMLFAVEGSKFLEA